MGRQEDAPMSYGRIFLVAFSTFLHLRKSAKDNLVDALEHGVL